MWGTIGKSFFSNQHVLSLAVNIIKPEKINKMKSLLHLFSVNSRRNKCDGWSTPLLFVNEVTAVCGVFPVVEKDTKESTPGNMSRCSTPLVTPPPTSTTRQTTRAAQTGRNYGPAATMFDYSDTIRHTGAATSLSQLFVGVDKIV